MNAHQKANLHALSRYLTGPLQAQFEMTQFCDDESCLSPTCGTIGCSLGHGTYAVEPRQYEGGVPERWYDYGRRVFGAEPKSREWEWMFGESWGGRWDHESHPGSEFHYTPGPDNTPQGAAARIDVFLNRGVPSDYLQQMYGEVPLCY